jgi:four helix bundle protein
MSDFKHLQVWHKAHHISLRATEVAARLQRRKPKLANQLDRAAESVPALIAEGRGRATDADFAHYVSMAIASANEVENHLQKGYDSGVIPRAEYTELTDGTIEVRKMLYGLKKKLCGE